MTAVDDELFILVNYAAHGHVAVFSINNYQLLQHLRVPGYQPADGSDITSSIQHRCLYMSDPDKKCVHRYGLASGATSKWPVPSKPRGLSITPNGNLLVTCWGASDKLVELSAFSGRCVREITLESEVVGPHHSMQLTTGEYLVYHSDLCRGFERVCVVGGDGKATGNIDYLSGRCNFAVDEESRFIFVANEGNASVVLLSPKLEFVRYIVDTMYSSRRLYFHQSTRRLFVHHGDVTVIQL